MSPRGDKLGTDENGGSGDLRSRGTVNKGGRPHRDNGRPKRSFRSARSAKEYLMCMRDPSSESGDTVEWRIEFCRFNGMPALPPRSCAFQMFAPPMTPGTSRAKTKSGSEKKKKMDRTSWLGCG
jgi:hypothetical protein